MIAIGLAAAIAAILATLPASLAAHLLPAAVQAEDFSGSLWHGSAGRIRVDGREAGALEWRLHPAALLGLSVAADLHWVKVGFVLDAAVTVDRHGFTARDIRGGGPIADLQELGVAAGWHGNADIHFSELKGDFSAPLFAAGDLKVANLGSAQFADGADLGGYDLQFPEQAGAGDGSLTAQLSDTGGPLQVQATINYSAKTRSAVLSGSLRARPDAPPALLRQLQSVSRGRDPYGPIPIDLEFNNLWR
jgi:hypothetical protein